MSIQCNCKAQFNSYKKRLRTFNNPNFTCVQPSKDFAEAGFIYYGYGDDMLCLFCNNRLRNWHHEDKPWEEHAMHSPECSYVKKHKTIDYIKDCQLKNKVRSIEEWMNSENVKQILNLFRLEDVKQALEIRFDSDKKPFKSYSELYDALTEKNEEKHVTSEFKDLNISRGKYLCKICLEAEIDTVFITCAHQVSCQKCS